MINILLFAFMAIVLQACSLDEPSYLIIEGKTMGTYYRVTYNDDQKRDFGSAIDSLLIAINGEISTYIPTSTVSQFNTGGLEFDLGLTEAGYQRCVEYPSDCPNLKNFHFLTNLKAAQNAYEASEGAFDPTVMPLVNYWGFGYTPQKGVEKVDSFKVDSLLQFVGFDKITIKDEGENIVLIKSRLGVQLDFGGTGQGYAIDAISIWLEQKGIENYLVDIGGECRSKGLNPKQTLWTIGVNTPKPDAELTDFTRIVQLDNNSISTSGNYRKFHELDGVKYSHFIDPRTGFPEKSTLLSASVFGKDCLTPDALATSFMVMGLDKAYALVSQMDGLEALFIYSDEAGNLKLKYTDGVEKMFKKE